MFQDLEYELGEVEFRDGIPDVKFSRVRIIHWRKKKVFLYSLVLPQVFLILRMNDGSSFN